MCNPMKKFIAGRAFECKPTALVSARSAAVVTAGGKRKTVRSGA